MSADQPETWYDVTDENPGVTYPAPSSDPLDGLRDKVAYALAKRHKCLEHSGPGSGPCRTDWERTEIVLDLFRPVVDRLTTEHNASCATTDQWRDQRDRKEAAEADLRVEREATDAANARAERWRQRHADAVAEVARLTTERDKILSGGEQALGRERALRETLDRVKALLVDEPEGERPLIGQSVLRAALEERGETDAQTDRHS